MRFSKYLAFLILFALAVNAKSQSVSNDVSLYGWLDQHSLDSSNNFIGNEACGPTSFVNGLTYLQNTTPSLFGTNLTGGTNISSTQGSPNSYNNWMNTDQTLIGLMGTSTASGGTSVTDLVAGGKVYLLRVGYYSDITIKLTNASIPALTNALNNGDAVEALIRYTNGNGGHLIMLNGINWNTSFSNGTLYFVDPLDPSQNYSNSSVLGPVLQTYGTLTETNGNYLLQYEQLWGNNLTNPYPNPATNTNSTSAYLTNLTILSVTPSSNTNPAWSNLVIGSNSTPATYSITNGTSVYSNTLIGFTTTSSNNLLIVANTNTLLSNSVNLYVGNSGASNAMLITNGGVVTGEYGVVGNYSTSSNNLVLVTGTNSVWTNAGDIAVGFDGSGNSLVISNGGAVLGGTNGVGGIIGADIPSSNNAVLVTGSNSTWSNSLDLYVGFAGNNNSLTISNSAVVRDANGFIGNYYLSSNNVVLVTGTNSLWSNSGTLTIGAAGGGTLTVANGGLLVASEIRIGQYGDLDFGRFQQSDSAGSVVGDIVFIATNDENYGINFNQTNTFNFSNNVSGAGWICALGTGTTIMSGSNSYSQYTIIDKGAIMTTSTNALGTGYIYLNGETNAAALLLSNNLTISSLSSCNGGTNNLIALASGAGASTLTINGSDSTNYSGLISGAMTFVRSGSGTTTLSGSNSYTGGTTIRSGQIVAASTNALGTGPLSLGGTSNTATLSLGTNLTISRLNWESNGVVALTPGSQTLAVTGLMSNVASGGGALSFANATLNNTTNMLISFGSQSGFTTSNFSVVGVTGYSFLLTTTNVSSYIASNANLAVTGSTTVNGSLQVVSLSVNGGTTTVSSGASLTSSNSVNVNSSSTLVDNGSITTPILAVASGGAFSMVGGILNGNLNNAQGGTVYTDPSVIYGNVTNAGTYISEGADVINGNVVNSGSFTMSGLTVNGLYNNSGTITGFGTLNGNVTSSGSITPTGTNSPIGTITVNGNLTLQNGSVLTIATTGITNSSVNVSGATTLTGTLVITPTTGTTLSYGQKIIFMSAASFSGSFSSVVAPAGYRGRVVIEGDPTVSVIMAPASYTQLAQNQNQVNVATALNSFIPATSGDQLVISTSLDSLTASQYNQAFNAIMPTFYQQMATIAFNEANALNMELNQRLWGVRLAEGGGFSMSGLADNYPMIQEGQGDGSGKGVLDAKKDILRPGLDNHWGLFVDGNGIFAQANSANMLPGYNSESGGITTGLTYKWNDKVASGIYAGYQGTYTKSGANGSGLGTGSSLTDNAVRFGVFGTYGNKDGKGLYLNALAGGAYHNYQATRVIQYTGINRTANSQPGAGELDTMLATGYDIQRGKFTFGPTASLQYTYLGVNSLNETGAQSLNYNSGGWNSSSMLSSVCAHAAYNWVAHHGSGGDIVVVPQINLNWQHEFMQNPYDISGNLGGTSPTFSNWSAAPIRDFLYTGVGFTVDIGKRWNTSFFYNAAAGNQNLTSQNIFWSAGVKF